MVERNILAFTRNEETFKKALNINW
jgi:hypothetical protein